MTANQTTIEAITKVTGLDQLQKASDLMEKMFSLSRKLGENNVSGSGYSSMSEAADKAVSSNKKLADSFKMVGDASKSTSLANTYTKGVDSADKLSASNKKLADSYKVASNASKSFSDKSSTGFNSLGTNIDRSTEKVGRFGQSLKDAFAMFSVGMLGAQAVMSLASAINDKLKAGVDYVKSTSGMIGTWKTLTEGNENPNKAVVGTPTGIVAGITNTSIQTGRNRTMVDEAEQLAYHRFEDAGQTNRFITNEMTIADAMGMSDSKAGMFTQDAGYALDRGKLQTRQYQQLVSYAPGIREALERSLGLLKSNQKMSDLTDKQRKTLDASLQSDLTKGKVTSDVFAKAINWAGEVKYASAIGNAQHTIPGFTRTVNAGMTTEAGMFMQDLGNEFLKTFGVKGGLMDKVLAYFTNPTALKATAQKAATSLIGVVNALYKLEQAAKPYAVDFGKGFISGVKEIKNDAIGFVKDVKGIGKDIENFLPSSVRKNIQSSSHDFASFVGKATAFVVGFKIFSHLPVIGTVFKDTLALAARFASKIPIIGGAISKLLGGGTLVAGTKFSDLVVSAGEQFARTVSGASGVGAGGAGVAGGTLAQDATLAKDGEEAAVSLKGMGGIAGLVSLFKNGGIKTGLTAVKDLVSSKVGLSALSGSLVNNGMVGTLAKGGLKLSNGFLGLNTALTGFEVYNTLQNTKKGSTARYSGVGSDIGSGVGSVAGGIIGGALLTPLGLAPVGAVAGSIAGGYLGGKIGSKAGKTVHKQSQSNQTHMLPGYTGYDAYKQTASANQKAATSYKSVTKAANTYASAVKSAIGSEKLSSSAKKNLANISGSLTKAQQKYNDAVKKYGPNSKDARNALKGLTNEQKAAAKVMTGSSSKAAVSQVQKLGKAMAASQKDSKNLTTAQTNYNKALTKSQSANQKAADAEKKYTSFVREHGKDAKGAKALEDQYTNAKKKAKDASDKLASAASKEVGANSKAAAASKLVASMLKLLASGADQGTNSVSKLNAILAKIPRVKNVDINVKVNGATNGNAAESSKVKSAVARAENTLVNYASGTIGSKRVKGFASGGHPGGLAKVNDGKGGYWRESFQLENGMYGLFPDQKDMVVDLPAGTQVFDGNDTHKKFPHYANGTNGSQQIKSKGGSFVINMPVTIKAGSIDMNNADKIGDIVGNSIGEKLTQQLSSIEI